MLSKEEKGSRTREMESKAVTLKSVETTKGGEKELIKDGWSKGWGRGGGCEEGG